VAVNYAHVPKKRPKLSAKNIRERDGNRCQYTGKVLHPDEGSLDHVVPRSRGGKDSWENLVWSAKEVNHRKAAETTKWQCPMFSERIAWKWRCSFSPMFAIAKARFSPRWTVPRYLPLDSEWLLRACFSSACWNAVIGLFSGWGWIPWRY
jgi:hypothetical protein